MTKAYSMPDDNGGRCEACDRPETEYQHQTLHPVLLGGGLGAGSMWLCAACREARKPEGWRVRAGVVEVVRYVQPVAPCGEEG